MMRALHAAILCSALTAIACGDDQEANLGAADAAPSTDGGVDAGEVAEDAGTGGEDAGTGGEDAGTGGEDAGTGGEDAGETTDSGMASADFTAAYAVIAARCGPCHIGQANGDLDLSTQAIAYANLVEVQASATSACAGAGLRVAPGDAAASLLYAKLTNTQTCGGLMPPSGMLSEAELTTIREWIEGGAPQ
jgi:hypothetical protein